MTTVMPMAFVWSRLALAALLAAGAACAPADACPDGTANRTAGDDGASAPRLACCDNAQLVLLDVADDVLGGALIPVAPSVASAPRLAFTIEPPAAHHAPAIARDVLVVAPKTSPPQT
jgi:hypothetical protein